MIRELTPEDGLKVAQFLTEVKAEAWELRSVMAEIRQYGALGSFENNELAAFVLYRVLPEHIEITWLCTRPKYRRMGQQKALLEKISCLEGGRKGLWLELRESNEAAQKLYEAFGFLQVGQRKNYYSNGESALLMEFKPLQSL